MKISFKKTFLKRFDRLEAPEQERVVQALQEIKNYLSKGKAPYGLRVKKLGAQTYEGRVSDALRIVWIRFKEEIIFALLGNHEEVRRFLKNS